MSKYSHLLRIKHKNQLGWMLGTPIVTTPSSFSSLNNPHLMSLRPVPKFDENRPLESVQRALKSEIPTPELVFDFSSPQSTPEITLIAPINLPPMIYAVGLNYASHAEETKLGTANANPIVIGKSPTALLSPYKSIQIPQCASRDEVDFEVELAVVIGKRCKDVKAGEANDYVLGYTVMNDVTARKWQGARRGGGQWTRSKSFDTFAPCGPAIRLSPFDASSLSLRSSLCKNNNNKKDDESFTVMQDANTRDLIHSVGKLVEFISQDTTLHPWTIISTGTPAGVGYTRTPPVYLEQGDVIRCEIEGIGVLENEVR